MVNYDESARRKLIEGIQADEITGEREYCWYQIYHFVGDFDVNVRGVDEFEEFKTKYGFDPNTAECIDSAYGDYNFDLDDSGNILGLTDNELDSFFGFGGTRYIYTWEYNGVKYFVFNRQRIQYETGYHIETSEYYLFDDTVTLEEAYADERVVDRISAARELQPQIATWYKVLRLIAIVGLLSILVYVGIRMIISSTGQDKAKYKKMFTDWLVAMCILFILQYIMVFTMTITETVTDIFVSDDGTGLLGPDGEDKLMSKIRADISDYTDENVAMTSIFSNMIIYLVLVIFTVMFVWQYLKRLAWLAFLTMIAPLIALTYPLDKLKDGQAQAFGLWIKEYVFNALLPIIHIVLYYVLIDSAMTFIEDGNWLYAIAAVGFMVPAEKFFRKMFGFDKASTASQFGAAAGGAMVMNAINKMGSKAKGAAVGAAGGDSKKSQGIRTADRDPLQGLQNGAQGSGAAGANSGGGVRTNPNPAGGAGANPQPGGINPVATQNAQSMATSNPTLRQRMSARYNKLPAGIRGVAHLARKQTFTRKAAQRNLRALAKVGGALAGGTIGLAAGIATGDVSKVVTFGAGGIMAGSKIGAGAVNSGFGAWDSAKAGIDNIRDGYNEGAYGAEAAENMRYDREFKRSGDYKTMVSNYPGQEDKIDAMLQAGVTDPKAMNTILKNLNQMPDVSIEQAIAFNSLANQCSDSIMYDYSKFDDFLSKRGIDVGGATPEERKANLDKIKKKMIDFK